MSCAWVAPRELPFSPVHPGVNSTQHKMVQRSPRTKMRLLCVPLLHRRVPWRVWQQRQPSSTSPRPKGSPGSRHSSPLSNQFISSEHYSHRNHHDKTKDDHKTICRSARPTRPRALFLNLKPSLSVSYCKYSELKAHIHVHFSIAFRAASSKSKTKTTRLFRSRPARSPTIAHNNDPLVHRQITSRTRFQAPAPKHKVSGPGDPCWRIAAA